ncbi:hypothetical protein AERO9A_190142 [Aeromonas salmonicida]|nr:hypothetical protein AERO9A_190142 [Aeromonas salmonicida]
MAAPEPKENYHMSDAIELSLLDEVERQPAL